MRHHSVSSPPRVQHSALTKKGLRLMIGGNVPPNNEFSTLP